MFVLICETATKIQNSDYFFKQKYIPSHTSRTNSSLRPVYFLLPLKDYTLGTCMMLAKVMVHEHW